MTQSPGLSDSTDPVCSGVQWEGSNRALQFMQKSGAGLGSRIHNLKSAFKNCSCTSNGDTKSLPVLIVPSNEWHLARSSEVAFNDRH